MVSKDRNWRKLHNKGDPHIYANIRRRVNDIIKHQMGHGDMFSYWYGEAQKKEIILDAVRDCVETTENAERKIKHINKLVNEFIFKGITMRTNKNEKRTPKMFQMWIPNEES